MPGDKLFQQQQLEVFLQSHRVLNKLYQPQLWIYKQPLSVVISGFLLSSKEDFTAWGTSSLFCLSNKLSQVHHRWVGEFVCRGLIRAAQQLYSLLSSSFFPLTSLPSSSLFPSPTPSSEEPLWSAGSKFLDIHTILFSIVYSQECWHFLFSFLIIRVTLY